jgi:hypothetical protein
MAEMDLDQLLSIPIVSATQTEMRIVDAPSVISVLTRTELVERGYQSVGEALQHTVGFYVVDDHIVPNAAVRGISGGLRSESGLLKVMIDSRPVPFRPTGGHWLGPELVPLSAVERIEILRGPASAVYGADAFVGVVNIITRRGDDIAGADASGAGLFARDNPGGGIDMAAGVRRDELDVMMSFRYLYEDYSGLKLPKSSPAPRVPDYHAGRRGTRKLERESYVALTTLRYHLSDEHSVYASGYASAIERGAELSDWAQLSNGIDAEGRPSDNHVALANTTVALGGDFKISPTWTVNAQLGAFYGTNLPSDRMEVGSSVYYIERDLDSKGLDLTLSSSWTLPQLTLTASAGGVVDAQELPSTRQILKLPVGGQEPGDARNDTAIRQGDKTFWNPGARVQVIWRPLAAVPLDLTGGGRYDYHSIYGHRITGRTGIVYSPTDRLNFKLLYGSAFKAPSTQLLYGAPLRPGDIQGNALHDRAAVAVAHRDDGRVLRPRHRQDRVLAARGQPRGRERVRAQLAELGDRALHQRAQVALGVRQLRLHARAPRPWRGGLSGRAARRRGHGLPVVRGPWRHPRAARRRPRPVDRAVVAVEPARQRSEHPRERLVLQPAGALHVGREPALRLGVPARRRAHVGDHAAGAQPAGRDGPRARLRRRGLSARPAHHHAGARAAVLSRQRA